MSGRGRRVAMVLCALAAIVVGVWSWTARERLGALVTAALERFRTPGPASRLRSRIVPLRAGQAASVAMQLEAEARRRRFSTHLIAPHQGTNAILLQASAGELAVLERSLRDLDR